jgi:DUF2934 family protein
MDIIDNDSIINCDDIALRRRAELHWHPHRAIHFPLHQECEALRSKRIALIRRCAYSRWANRRCQPGGGLEDWLSAEWDVDRLFERRDQMIREAAYFRWQQRQCEPGRALGDWLDAERQIDAQLEL